MATRADPDGIASRLVQLAWLAVWAGLLAFFICYAAGNLNDIYYQGHPFIGDSTSFFAVQFGLWNDAQTIAKETVLWNRFLAEWKNPGLYLSYLYLPADYMISVNGHLPYTGIALWSFFLAFSAAVLQRSGSIVYATVSSLVIFCLIGLFDPVYQLPSKLADPPAVFFYGGAIAAIFASDGGKRLAWLAVAGTLIAMTLLSRFIAAGYIFVAAAPLLAVYWAKLLVERRVWVVIAGVACVAAPIALLAGYHLLTFTGPVLEFYRTAGYGLNQGAVAALETTGRKFLEYYFQPWGVAVPALITALYIVQYWRRARLQDVLIGLWPVLAHPLLILFILTVEDDAPQLTYVIGPYLLLAVAPFALRSGVETAAAGIRPRFLAAAIAPALLVLALTVPFGAAMTSYVYPIAPLHIAYAGLNHRLAAIANDSWRSLHRPVTIDAAFDYYWRYLLPTAFRDTGAVLLTTRGFDIRQEQWPTRDSRGAPTEPGYADRAIPEMMRYYGENTDLLFVLSNPDAPEALVGLKDAFTTDMAKRLRTALRTDANWQVVATAIGGPYGEVEVWRNVRRTQ